MRGYHMLGMLSYTALIFQRNSMRTSEVLSDGLLTERSKSNSYYELLTPVFPSVNLGLM